MFVTAWNNGRHCKTGAGYGLKISRDDRDAFFAKEWNTVFLEIPTFKEIFINVNKASFWDKRCRELISKEVGLFFIETGLTPWPKNSPPRLVLTPISENRFILSRIQFQS